MSRPFSYDGDRVPFDVSFYSVLGHELVPRQEAVTDPMWYRVVPDEDVCFRDAVIGVGNACAQSYCESHQRPIHAEEFRLWTLDYYRMRKAAPNHNVFVSAMATHASTLHARAMTSLIPSHQPKRKSRVRVGFMNRYETRNVPNMLDLMASIQLLNSNNDAIRYDVVDINLNHAPPLDQVAPIFQKLDVLITPHGSGMGNAIWMPPKSTVISLNCRFCGPDWWFQTPMLVMQKRFWSWTCQEEWCTVPDEALLQSKFAQHRVSTDLLTPTEFDIMVKTSRSFGDIMDMVKERIKDDAAHKTTHELIWPVWFDYLKDINRRVDVTQVTAAVKSIARDMAWGLKMNNGTKRRRFSDVSFEALCDAGQCCGGGCSYPLKSHFGRDLVEWDPLLFVDNSTATTK
jgi:hypothetical protein